MREGGRYQKRSKKFLRLLWYTYSVTDMSLPSYNNTVLFLSVENKTLKENQTTMELGKRTATERKCHFCDYAVNDSETVVAGSVETLNRHITKHFVEDGKPSGVTKNLSDFEFIFDAFGPLEIFGRLETNDKQRLIRKLREIGGNSSLTIKNIEEKNLFQSKY